MSNDKKCECCGYNPCSCDVWEDNTELRFPNITYLTEDYKPIKGKSKITQVSIKNKNLVIYHDKGGSVCNVLHRIVYCNGISLILDGEELFSVKRC
jgi:hypothetical protein